MPEQGVFQDLFPGPDARHRCVHEHQLGHPVRMLLGEGEGDHVADVVADHFDLLDLQSIEHAGDVAALGLLVVAAGRMRRQAHAAQVRHDHGVVTRQPGGQRRPHVARLAIAVQQDHRRPMAADSDMDLGAVGRDRLCLERRRVRRDLRQRRGRQHQCRCGDEGEQSHLSPQEFAATSAAGEARMKSPVAQRSCTPPGATCRALPYPHQRRADPGAGIVGGAGRLGGRSGPEGRRS